MEKYHKEEQRRLVNCPLGTRVWYTVEREWHKSLEAPYPNVSWDQDLLYVVDDEYAEVRKFYKENGYIYVKGAKATSPNVQFTCPVEDYSIAEPRELKEGDWVVAPEMGPALLVAVCVGKEFRNKVEFSSGRTGMYWPNELKLWEPTNGELCLFTNYSVHVYTGKRGNTYMTNYGTTYTGCYPLEKLLHIRRAANGTN